MKNIFLAKITVFFILFLNFSTLNAKISNFIVVKVGNEIVSNIEVENEIKRILFFSKKELNAKNIEAAKPVAIKFLIDNAIKKTEVTNYKITDYNSKDLENYVNSIAKNFQTDESGLKKIFKEMDLDYNSFVENHKIELLWKTLIFLKYKDQISINQSEIEKELAAVDDSSTDKEYKLSEIEIPKTKDVDVVLSKVYDEIKKNGFRDAVKKYSSSNSILNNGNIGWFSEKSLSINYLNKIKLLNKGDVSEPISNENSFVIINIDEIRFKPTFEKNIQNIKTNIVNQKKNEKLSLFSRSHFSNLRNKTLVAFK